MLKANFNQWINGRLSLFFLLAVTLTLINFFTLKSSVLGLILVLIWLFGPMAGFCGSKTGIVGPLWLKNILGLFLSFSLIIVLASVSFYLGNFSRPVMAVIYLGLSLLIFFWLRKNKVVRWQKGQLLAGINRRESLNVIVFLLLCAFCLFFLLAGQSEEALRSPWQVVSPAFFFFYFLAGLFLAKIIFSSSPKGEKNDDESAVNRKLILIFLFALLSFSVSVIVYKIGFGFDSFVHRAAESKLAELGYITPKPFYYIGEYTLVVWLASFFFLPLEWINKLLVPALAAFFLPGFIYYFIAPLSVNKKTALAVTLTLVLALTPLFFYSVPQALSNLWLAVFALLLFTPALNKKEFCLILASIFFIHPLTGISALIIFFFRFFGSQKIKSKRVKIILMLPIFFLAPLFFYAASIISSQLTLNFSLNSARVLPLFFADIFRYLRFNSIFHAVYLYHFNFLLVVFFLLAIGLARLKRDRENIYPAAAKSQLFALAAFTVNFLLLSLADFSFVIAYEKGEYVKRFAQTAALALMPAFLSGLAFVFGQIGRLKSGAIITVFFLPALLTVNLYLAYPRLDAFQKNRGYSVSAADIEAARWIGGDGGQGDYLVLANQSVAAASLREFGFLKYYQMENEKEEKQSIFYYPLPTSSPLYDIYLRMVDDEPKRIYIEQARQLVGGRVSRIYFVLNNYWLDAEKIASKASLLADSVRDIDGKIRIFVFQK